MSRRKWKKNSIAGFASFSDTSDAEAKKNERCNFLKVNWGLALMCFQNTPQSIINQIFFVVNLPKDRLLICPKIGKQHLEQSYTSALSE